MARHWMRSRQVSLQAQLLTSSMEQKDNEVVVLTTIRSIVIS
jgi:hypothetical protein